MIRRAKGFNRHDRTHREIAAGRRDSQCHPYLIGVQNFITRRPSNNPYPDGSKDHELCQKGYNDAQRDCVRGSDLWPDNIDPPKSHCQTSSSNSTPPSRPRPPISR